MRVIFLTLPLFLFACSGDWSCVQQGDTLFSMNSSGQLGSADKGCTCDEIRSFERRVFGSVDEDALRTDFGCR